MKRKLIVDLSWALIWLALVGPAFAQSDAEFAKATQEYSAGDFQAAINSYETLVRSGDWSANLFYDLGNAYFRAGDLGRAILNYERALALERHHPEAEANLRIARDQARALELTAGSVERVFRFANRDELVIAAAIAFWLATFSLVRLLFARRRGAGAIPMSILLLSIFAGAAFASYELENGAKGKALAIVVANDVEARLATADNAHSVLALPPGSEIRILSTRGEWVYATLPNNLRGWLPVKSAELVRL
jgi:tetratricopeptide (TPR) repeat protein